MAYSNDNLYCVQGFSVGGQRAQKWVYEGTDTVSAVMAAGFISNASERGMRVGDEIVVKQFSTTALTTLTQAERLIVSAVVAGTGATLKTAVIGSGTATAGAVTVNTLRGQVTSESLTTAAGDTPYTLTLTNSQIGVSDMIFPTLANGTNTQGVPLLGPCKCAAGSATITVYNKHASQALNGTLIIGYRIEKA